MDEDGVRGLLFRGLGATLAREVPSFGFYFAAYECTKGLILSLLLTHASPLLGGGGGSLAFLAPLVGGAAAGVAAWVPVYPIDVVKTNLQVFRDGVCRLVPPGWGSCGSALGGGRTARARLTACFLARDTDERGRGAAGERGRGGTAAVRGGGRWGLLGRHRAQGRTGRRQPRHHLFRLREHPRLLRQRVNAGEIGADSPW